MNDNIERVRAVLPESPFFLEKAVCEVVVGGLAYVLLYHCVEKAYEFGNDMLNLGLVVGKEKVQT